MFNESVLAVLIYFITTQDYKPTKVLSIYINIYNDDTKLDFCGLESADLQACYYYKAC